MQNTNCKLNVERNYTKTLPFGWYFVCFSDELAKCGVKTVTYFGQEWVLFRNEKNEVGLIEPYCLHLGAHIGVGGKVDGELIRCPFHAWGYDKSGYCKSIPYAKKEPCALKTTSLNALPIVEVNEIVWAWYHPEKSQPLWNIECISCIDIKNWTDFTKFEFMVNTSVQDITENSVDYAHLKYVHGHTTNFNGQLQYAGISRTMHIDTELKITNANGQPDTCQYSIHLSQHGPGQQIVHYRRMVDLIMLYLVTPVTNECSMIRFAFTHPKYPKDSNEQRLVQELLQEKVELEGNLKGIKADIPIWNNKIYRSNPLLCDGDGPIMQFRNWFQQFYINK